MLATYTPLNAWIVLIFSPCNFSPSLSTASCLKTPNVANRLKIQHSQKVVMFSVCTKNSTKKTLQLLLLQLTVFISTTLHTSFEDLLCYYWKIVKKSFQTIKCFENRLYNNTWLLVNLLQLSCTCSGDKYLFSRAICMHRLNVAFESHQWSPESIDLC